MQHPSGLLTVDLSAIQRNWLRLRDGLSAGAECGAVVKADAYGLGMAPVARSLRAAGCRSFFVVNIEEGIALRRVLGGSPDIYLLQGVAPGAEPICLAEGLIPVIVTYAMAQHWLAFCETSELSLVERRSALKINTGMNRLGLELHELQALVDQPGCLGKIGCELLISHLACAEDASHPLNHEQLAAFTQALAQVRRLLPAVRASLANSAATLRGRPWHFDLVRPGIGLYGSNPLGNATVPQHQMEPVVTLQLPVVQSRRVKPGSAVGYGATYIADTERHLVTVAGGYGDGIFRSLGNSGSAWFKRALPIVGRVSMDSFMVDVSSLPPAERPVEGDAIELLGHCVGVDATARAAGTVAYEVLTRLTGRYHRRYLAGDPARQYSSADDPELLP